MPRVEPNISREKLFELLGYEPHSEEQWEAHRCPSRFRIACCGRRWGKSTWAGKETTLKMFIPDSINWIVGPQYTLGEKEFRVVHNDFKTLGLLDRCRVRYNVDMGKMWIHFKDLNSLVEVKSATHPEGLVGEGIDHVCMSEAAKHSRSTWEMYIRPALQDKRGSADFPSTPQGFNWYKGLFDIGMDEAFPDYASFHFPSWTNKVLFPDGYDDDEIQEVKRNTSQIFFAQEIGAEFTAFEGMIYPEFRDDLHVRKFDYNPQYKNWLALDFGYVDPFVALDIMIDPADRVWVWREYMVSYKSTGEHGQYLANRENPQGYHVDAIAADPRGADEIATLTWILGGIMHNGVGWELGVEQIKRALKPREDGLPGLIIHPRCGELIKMMKQLRAKTIKEGHNERKGQHDFYDHGPDALRYFFNEYFVLGSNESLRDLYDVPLRGSEAAGFFKYETGITLNEPIGSLTRLAR